MYKSVLLSAVFITAGLQGAFAQALLQQVTINGQGSGDVGYQRYSGPSGYKNLVIQFLLPELRLGEYFSSGEFSVEFGTNRGVYQSYGLDRTMSANINSLQTEQWTINRDSYQNFFFSLNSSTLSAMMGVQGQTISTQIDLFMPYGFNSYTTTGWVTIDSSKLTLFVVPEPSSLSLLAMGGFLVALRRRR